jgi:hypothetical protein
VRGRQTDRTERERDGERERKVMKGGREHRPIIPAHMLWIVSIAVVPTHPVDSASKITVVSCLDKAEPPTSSRTKIPPKPSSAHFLNVSVGKTPSSSHFAERQRE